MYSITNPKTHRKMIGIADDRRILPSTGRFGKARRVSDYPPQQRKSPNTNASDFAVVTRGHSYLEARPRSLFLHFSSRKDHRSASLNGLACKKYICGQTSLMGKKICISHICSRGGTFLQLIQSQLALHIIYSEREIFKSMLPFVFIVFVFNIFPWK